MSGRRGDFRWRRTPPVQVLLYVLLRVVIMVIDMFPYRMGPHLGRILGRIIRLIDRKHARIAVKNLEKSRGVCPPDEIPAFIDRVYEHMGLGIVEMLNIPRLLERHQVEHYCRFERFHVVEEARAGGKGLIVVIGHLGNWELCGLAVVLAGIPIHSLARPIDNPWVDRWLHRYRTQTGQEIIPKYHAIGSMIRVLQKNEVLIVQIDQDARHSGVYVNFFGRPASTHRSPAVLALKYGTPIVVANIYREGGFHYCVLSDPIHPEAFKAAADPIKALTQAYSEKFEECVRAHPDQWFWVHDRWKTAERDARKTSEALV
jgi:Kdo2-lipid IVA lauroyltransferase/acyltransferase